MRFLAILWRLIRLNGLILHILIDKDDIKVLMLIKMLGRVSSYA